MSNVLSTSFPVFLEAEVGGRSKDLLLHDIQEANRFASDGAVDVMSRPGWRAGSRERVRFARTAVSGLGFTRPPTAEEVWCRIRELGHSLCEPQDGPAILLALEEELGDDHDHFWCAMNQIRDSGGILNIFVIMRDEDGDWLDTGQMRPRDRLSPYHTIVFRLGVGGR